MIVGSGNQHNHHKYKLCSVCNKKGVYTPMREVTRNRKGIIVYSPQCRVCGHIFKVKGKSFVIKSIK